MCMVGSWPLKLENHHLLLNAPCDPICCVYLANLGLAHCVNMVSQRAQESGSLLCTNQSVEAFIKWLLSKLVLPHVS